MYEEIAKKWYKQANHDLLMAEKNLEIEGYDVSAFLTQQAIEKFLKTIYLLRNKKIPRTHYLDDLIRELNLSDEILDLANDLTADYTLARYPDISDLTPYEEYNEEIALEKLNIAKQIYDKISAEFKGLK